MHGTVFFCIVPLDDITAASRKCIGLSYRGIRILAFFAGGFCYSGLIITFVSKSKDFTNNDHPINAIKGISTISKVQAIGLIRVVVRPTGSTGHLFVHLSCRDSL